MKRVTATITEGVSGNNQACVTASCSRCSHMTESFGTGDSSKKRCLAMLREECPNSEENFYVDEDE